ncbi:lectin [Brevibacillus laterosporus]|uniref:lectin n=1 Tax=Brevibacillus laterosporus TaxID=1465 RepID=UPI000839BB58|nr:lectin [Brevibacillus laterosporus]
MLKKVTATFFLFAMMLLLSIPAFAAAGEDHLDPGEKLVRGQYLKSTNGEYQLVMQDDGNLVLYGRGRALWNSNTHGQAASNLIMQGDGNLVIYGYPHAIWHSNTHNNPGARLVVQNDGNVVIYLAQKAIWWTGTN